MIALKLQKGPQIEGSLVFNINTQSSCFGSERWVTRAAGRLFIGWPTRLVIRVFAENLVGLGFL